MMGIVLSMVGGGLAIFGVVVGWRWLEAQSWRQSLVALALQFPRGLKADQLSAWLATLGSLRVPVALEIVATREVIAHYLLVPKVRRADVLAGTRGVLPGLRCDDAPEYFSVRPAPWRRATELRLTQLSHQLAVDRAETAAAAFLGSLGQLAAGESVWVQWLVSGMASPALRPAA